MHWLLDIHFNEDKAGVFDMNVQKVLNIARKASLNLIRIYKDANCPKRIPLSGIMRSNLFDFEVFNQFLDFLANSDFLF